MDTMLKLANELRRRADAAEERFKSAQGDVATIEGAVAVALLEAANAALLSMCPSPTEEEKGK
jgi:hypothetical protein